MCWYWSLGGLSLLGIISGLCLVTLPIDETVYAGKTLNQWLDGGYEPASMALQEIGSSAAPFILAKLSREDPRQGSLRRYHDLWAKTPVAIRKIIPKPKVTNFDELRACSALLELGPQVIPILSNRLKDPSPVVREVSAHALGAFRERGSNIRMAIPFLVETLDDPSIVVRTRAAWALDGNRSFAR